MSPYLDTKLGNIRDGDLLALVEELENAASMPSDPLLDFPLRIFLTQCLYPMGPEKRIPITTANLATAPVLEEKVGKLPDGSLRELCGELARNAGQALEHYSGHRVYVLLNKTIQKSAKAKPPTPRQQRWSAVIQLRRANR